ncbi:MAG: OmpA family protein [Gammaproteobacteria bacterium]|nr:OmpA family protein [Gammaproteobacteria bacterium]
MSGNSEGGGGGGAPLWMVTFADLMALMMTFFVLLYSFSSIDETKYRMIAVSLASGFGAVLVSPKSAPTAALGPPSMMPSPMNSPMGRAQMSSGSTPQAMNTAVAEQVVETLQDEIAEGIISVETTGNTVVIRFPEEIAFPPGSGDISEKVIPIIERLTAQLADAPGTIMVSGHTDNRPINTSRYQSNWKLSTDRAVSVVQLFEKIGGIESSRLTAVGHGDTKPIASNDTAEDRAKNRRVEIAVVQQQ